MLGAGAQINSAARRQSSDFTTASLERRQSHTNILYSQQSETFIHRELFKRVSGPVPPSTLQWQLHASSSRTASRCQAGTGPSLAAFGISSLLAKPPAVVLGRFGIHHAVQPPIAREGAASSGTAALRHLSHPQECAHMGSKIPAQIRPETPSTCSVCQWKRSFPQNHKCFFNYSYFLFPPTSSSPSHIQPSEGPTSCHAFHMWWRFALWARNTTTWPFFYIYIYI